MKDRIFFGCMLMFIMVWTIPFIPFVPVVVLFGGFKGDKLGDGLSSIFFTCILGTIVYVTGLILLLKAF